MIVYKFVYYHFMNNAQRLKSLEKTNKNIFQAKLLRGLWQLKENTFRMTIKRMVDQGLLLRLTKGLYALREDYSSYELANTFITPSYISFHPGHS